MKKIDIGCGYRPMADADVLTDLYPLEAKERAHGKVKIPRGKKFVKCNVEKMPFKNKEFDYAYCRQVLEHTHYPEKACAEIIRIAKAGRIETPSYFSEILFGWKYHKWLIVERANKLFFFQKRQNEDRMFGKFFRYAIRFNPVIKMFFKKYHYLFVNHFDWQDEFGYEVIRESVKKKNIATRYNQKMSELKVSLNIYWLWQRYLIVVNWLAAIKHKMLVRR